MPDSKGESPDRSGLIGNVVGLVAPVVMRQIDTNDLVDALDVNVIAESLDLDALLERIDVNEIAARLDLDALLERLDVNEIAARLDLDALVARLDVDEIAARLDLDALLDELDMARLTAGASQEVAISGLDLVRRQIMRADATVDGVIGGLLRRKPGARPDAPGRLDDTVELGGVETDPSELQRRDVSGHYAGPVTRVIAVISDVFAVVALNTGLVAALSFFTSSLFGVDLSSQTAAIITLVSLACLFLAWFWLPVALFGRTLAMAVLGVALVRRDGGVVSGARALVRAIALSVSLLIPILFIGLLLGKERLTFHDLVAGTTVVYDWGVRDAEQPVTIREQLSARVRRRESEHEATPG